MSLKMAYAEIEIYTEAWQLFNYACKYHNNNLEP